jgi:hypothetical protein
MCVHDGMYVLAIDKFHAEVYGMYVALTQGRLLLA